MRDVILQPKRRKYSCSYLEVTITTSSSYSLNKNLCVNFALRSCIELSFVFYPKPSFIIIQKNLFIKTSIFFKVTREYLYTLINNAQTPASFKFIITNEKIPRNCICIKENNPFIKWKTGKKFLKAEFCLKESSLRWTLKSFCRLWESE